MKIKLDDVIVVEGIHDLQKIQSIYDVDVLYTNGSAISQAFIEQLKTLSETRSIIVFTDPDFPGKKIRQTIMDAIPTVKHAFVDKALAQGRGKVGVEHASVSDIQEALNRVVTPVGESTQQIMWSDLISRDLIVGSDAKKKRDFLAKRLGIGHVNAKQFYKHLQIFGVMLEQIDMIIEEFEYEKSSNVE